MLGMLVMCDTEAGRAQRLVMAQGMVLSSCNDACPGAYAFIGGFLSSHILLGPESVSSHSMLSSICADHELVQCLSDQEDADGCLVDQDDEQGRRLQEGEIFTVLSGCWVPSEVSLTMEVSVDNAEQFVANPASQEAVEKGIADAANILPSRVRVELTAGRRRLETKVGRRLEEGVVNVAAFIHAEGGDLDAFAETVSAISSDTMAASLTDAAEDANLGVSVSVSSMSAAPAPALITSDTPSSQPPQTSFACKITQCSVFCFAFLMMQMAF